jgi:hypothetical protein
MVKKLNSEAVFIGVIGAGKCAKKLKEQAYLVGKAIALQGAVLVCGGLGGIMEAAAHGAREAGGLTVGIIPGCDRAEANPFCDVVIPTGVGEARNIIVVRTADAVVALHGKYGTITEIAFALKAAKPVVSTVVWEVFPEVRHIPDPDKAVKEAIKLAKAHRPRG